MPEESRKLALRIANVLESKKAIDVMVLDISHLTIIADCFVWQAGILRDRLNPCAMSWKRQWSSKVLKPIAERGTGLGGGSFWITMM